MPRLPTPAGLALLLALGLAASPTQAQPAKTSALPAPDPDDGGIDLPPGFRALVVADNLIAGQRGDALRFLTVADNGDIYVKSTRDGIFALRDTNGDGRADEIKRFGSGNGTGIALHDGWLYYSTTTALYRYKYTPGELVPRGEPQLIVSGLDDRRQHNSKAFTFDGEGHVLIEVGSPANALSDGDRQRGAKGKSPREVDEFLQTHGGYWLFDPNKPNQTLADAVHFSTGHRHSLAIAWHPVSRQFFMVMMGRDNLDTVDPDDYDALDNAERVAEEMHLLRQGANLGWPYTYWDPIKQARMVGPEFGGNNRKRDANPAYDPPLIAFPGHWAPLQMTVYTGTQFPEKYRGGMFVAFHGSWNRAPRAQAGYKIAFVPFGRDGLPTGDTAHGAGTYEDFATGFPGVEYFTDTHDARYRPSGVAVGPDGSLYVSETEKGRVWRIIYTGDTTPRARNRGVMAAPQSFPALGAETPGGKIYAQVCAACHMPNGSGVPGMQPALAGSQVVAGEATRLIAVLLKGPAAVLPADREKFQNTMPAFGAAYNDADLASVINYLRKNFAPGAAEVTPAQVAAERAKQ
jgi:glucose/arabinose dehydrogenase/mono/diheme cytochrome c family protein